MKRFVKINFPSKYGDFEFYVIKDKNGTDGNTVILTTKGIDCDKVVTVRIHSECLTGDVFGTRLCDCGEQKAKALKIISDSKNGIFVYARQEGRGIGLFNKTKAIKMQQLYNVDTYKANRILGFDNDLRSYDEYIRYLKFFFGVKKISLITTNPKKVKAFNDANVEISSIIKLSGTQNRHNSKYLRDKIVIGGHMKG